MSRGVKYESVEKRAMTLLVKKYGLTGAKDRLASMAGVTLPTLGKLAKENGIEVHRGRPAETGKVVAVVKKGKKSKGSNRGRRFSDEQKSEFASMIKEHGLTGTQRLLAAKGTDVTIVTLFKIAKANGITLQKGRPKAAA